MTTSSRALGAEVSEKQLVDHRPNKQCQSQRKDPGGTCKRDAGIRCGAGSVRVYDMLYSVNNTSIILNAAYLEEGEVPVPE